MISTDFAVMAKSVLFCIYADIKIIIDNMCFILTNRVFTDIIDLSTIR